MSIAWAAFFILIGVIIGVIIMFIPFKLNQNKIYKLKERIKSLIQENSRLLKKMEKAILYIGAMENAQASRGFIHYIKNFFTSISGVISLISSYDGWEKIIDNVDIVNQIKKLFPVLERMRDVLNRQSRILKDRSKKTEVISCIENTLEFLEYSFKHKGILSTFDYDPEIIEMFCYGQGSIIVALLGTIFNELENSIYNNKIQEGKIEIRLEANNDTIKIIIKSNAGDDIEKDNTGAVQMFIKDIIEHLQGSIFIMTLLKTVRRLARK
jgi:hypothetical protein